MYLVLVYTAPSGAYVRMYPLSNLIQAFEPDGLTSLFNGGISQGNLLEAQKVALQWAAPSEAYVEPFNWSEGEYVGPGGDHILIHPRLMGGCHLFRSSCGGWISSNTPRRRSEWSKL